MLNTAGRPLRAAHSSWHSVDAAAVIMRAALGVAFVAHGGQKLFAWFGGGGITGTTAYFKSLGYPSPHVFAYVSGIVEFFGGVAIALGLFTVLATFALIVEMVVATATVSFAVGFFVTVQAVGWELNVYLIGLLAALLLTGPGRWSLDAALGLTRWRTPAPGAAPSREGLRTPTGTHAK